MSGASTRRPAPGLDVLPPASRPWVFAVDVDRIQVTWGAGTFGRGVVLLRAADVEVELAGDGGPGAAVLAGLPPGRDVEVLLDGPGIDPRRRRLRATTLTPPPGRELFRFATVSDLHLGATSFGFRHRMVETPPPAERHPVRALRAALRAIVAWGAERLVVKGDLTHHGYHEHWDLLADALAGLELPVTLLPGNHDNDHHGQGTDPFAAAASRGLDLVAGVRWLDEPGLRLVLADTTVPGQDRGSLRGVADGVLDAAATTPAGIGVVVALHHHLERWPVVTHLPVGVRSTEGAAFLHALGRAHPASLVTSGHTHRHRRRQVGPVVVTEVGSPKDFPGTWAGYVVHEGGIRQTVWRVEAPDVLPWLDRSARAMGGMWGLWSPGRLRDRCFSHPWP